MLAHLFKLAAFSAMILFSAALLPGCGVIFAGPAFASAVSQNENFKLTGIVVDQFGKPLTDVYVNMSGSHVYIDALEGTAPKSEGNVFTNKLDGTFELNSRGSEYTFTFKKDGYRSVQLMIAKGSNIVTTSSFSRRGSDELATGNSAYFGQQWPKGAPLRIVLEPNDFVRPWLPTTGKTITFPADATSTDAFDISSTQPKDDGVRIIKLDLAKPAPGCIFITVIPGQAVPRADHSVDPLDIALPERITLHVSAPGGFVRYLPQAGSSPWAQMGEAPASGYAGEFIIERIRLKQMRKAGGDSVIDGHEFFFFKVGEKFGKAEVHWGAGGEGLDTRITLTATVQPNNSTNLISRDPR